MQAPTKLDTSLTISTWHRKLTRAFFHDLRHHPYAPRLAIFFDQYEKADHSFQEWFNKVFLPGINHQSLLVVVAGQQEIEYAHEHIPQIRFALSGVDVKWFLRFAQEQQVAMEPNLIAEFHRLLRGCPKQFVEYLHLQRFAKAN